MYKYRNAARRFAAKVAATGTGLLASGLALATPSTDLSAGLTAVKTAHEGELWAIGGIILGLCAIGFMIARARRQTGG